jgi:hypothetical protein
MNTVAGNEALVLYGARQYPDINFYGLNPGLIKSNIRSNMSGGQDSIRHRVTEGIISILTIRADTYAGRIAPLLFSTDIESASGAFFNQKAMAILPSEIMTPSYVDEYNGSFRQVIDACLTKRFNYIMKQASADRKVGDVDRQACPRGKNWRGRNHASIIVRTVGLPPI